MHNIFQRHCIIVIISALFIACTHPCNTAISNDAPIIKADVNALSDDASLFFDSYRSVVLETFDNNMIGEINNIDMDSTHIVIASGQTIHIFDSTGVALCSFNKFGQGPDEYIELSDLKLSDGKVFVLSRPSKKIYTYTFNGTLTDIYELPYFYTRMIIDGDDIWLASETSNESKFEFARYNINKRDITLELLPFDKDQSCFSSSFSPFLCKSDKSIFVARQFDLNVYEINTISNNIIALWKYHFNTAKQLNDYDLSLSFSELYAQTANKPLVKNPGIMFKNGDSVYQTISVFFKIGYFTNIYHFICNDTSSSGKMLRIGLQEYEHFPYLRTSPLTIYNGEYVSAMDAAQVLMIEEYNGTHEFIDKGVTNDSNPILFFHHFKVS